MPKEIVKANQRYGKLVTKEKIDVYFEKSGKTRKKWVCQCDCGNTTILYGAQLIAKRSPKISCGCVKNYDGHCKENKRLYAIWSAMKQRCYLKTSKAYQNYGGRGIKVCKEWANDYNSFRTWALSTGYASKMTIDRIDVNGNYEPNNCRWITKGEQSLNKRNNLYVFLKGDKLTASQADRILGFGRGTTARRIRDGWTNEEIISVEPSRSNSHYHYNKIRGSAYGSKNKEVHTIQGKDNKR